MVKVLQVFKPASPSGVVDKSKPFDYHNKIECSHDSPKLIPKQEEIYKDKVRIANNLDDIVFAERRFLHHSFEE